MAGLLAEMNLFDEALAAQKRSLTYFSQTGDTLEMVRTYGEMASSYAALNEIDSLLVCLIRLDSLKAGLYRKTWTLACDGHEANRRNIKGHGVI